MSATDENVEDLTPSRTLVNGIRIYFSVALVGWLAFEIARKRMLRTYYCRDYSAEWKHSLIGSLQQQRWFTWLYSLYMVKDDWILMNCGMDALFYLRFLRMCQKIAMCGMFLSGMLFPLYHYAASDSADTLYKLTLSHLVSTSGEWRFWFPLLALIAMSFFTLYLLGKEYEQYVIRRHEFLGRQALQQYSVVITGLPSYLRQPQVLRKYMDDLFPDSVLHVYIAVECSHLELLVRERTRICNQLEHSLALSAHKSDRVLLPLKVSRCWKGDTTSVDAIDHYQSRLDTLNTAVLNEARRLSKFEESGPTQDFQIGPITSAVEVLAFTENNEYQALHSPSDNDSKLRRKEKSGISTEMLHDDSSVSNPVDGMLGCAFVTFNNLRATQAAQQVLQCADPTHMIVEEAPPLEEVLWQNVGVSHTQKLTFFMISFALTCGIILFWTIPTSLVVSLANVDQLQKKWKWLRDVVADNHWISAVLEQVAPLVMVIMSSMAPMIFGILSKREGHASESKVNSSLFNKLVSYQSFVTFLLPLIVDSLVQSITTFAKDFGALVNTLSGTIPVKSSYYMSYVIIQLGLNMTLELLRVVPIVKGTIYDMFAPKLTAKQRESAWFGLQPVHRPGPYEICGPLSEVFLVLILILVFAPIAPMMCYVCLLYFSLSELINRWSFICVFDPRPHSSADFFPSVYRFCIGAVLLSQFVMAGLLALKKVPAPAAVALLLPIATIAYHMFIASRYVRPAKNLPLDKCTLVDARRARKMEMLTSVLEESYKQPALAECGPVKPDYSNLGSECNNV